MTFITKYSHTLTICATLLLSVSCNDSSKDRDKITTIFVEKNFGSGELDNLTGKIEIETLFTPEFTDSTMFSTPNLCSVSDGKAFLTENRGFGIFDFPSGQLVKAFNHIGGGPEEYKDFNYSYYVPSAKEWTIIEDNVFNVNIYQFTTDGGFVRKVRNDSIQSLSPTSGGWLAFNQSSSVVGGFQKVREKKIYQYNADWELVHTYDLKENRWAVPQVDRMDEVMRYDGTNYVSDRDTIYSIDTENHRLSPRIAFAMGGLSTDWGKIETMEDWELADKKYIYFHEPMFNSRYLFVRYHVTSTDDDTLYFDVYSLGDGELVFRHKRLKEKGASWCIYYEGIPIEYKGENLYGWPVMVDDDSFYVMIASDELAKIDEADTTNPVFAKIKIKE